MDLCWKSDICAFEYPVYVCHSFPYKEHASFYCKTSVRAHSDFWSTRKENLLPFPLFPLLFAVMWWGQMPWSYFFKIWVLGQLFHSSLSSSLRCPLVPLHFLPLEWSFAYLRLVIFVPAILIPTCNSSNWAFHMICPAYKLNKQGDKIQSCNTPFPILISQLLQVRF